MTPRVRPRAPAALLAVVAVLATQLLAPAAARADSTRDRQWYLDRLGVTAAWQHSRGTGVLVAVIDSGVAATTPDLHGAVVAGQDFSGIGSPDGHKPISVHGTEVASVLAGRGHGAGGADGVIGTAPAARILPISVMTLTDAATGQIAQAISWAVDHHARVINLSLSTPDDPTLKDAIEYAEAHDVVVVAAAGNDGPNTIGPPATYPGVVGVSGIDANLRIDPSSSTGPGVALAAPFSTRPTVDGSPPRGGGLPVANPPHSIGGDYTSEAGTSLATPIVAGIAALIRSRWPKMDAANVVNRLVRTATPRGSGRPNDDYGYGVLNAAAALTAKVPIVTRNPLGSLVPAKSTSSPPTGSRQPQSHPPAAAPSSGPGIGVWIAIAVLVLILVVLIGLLVQRRRT